MARPSLQRNRLDLANSYGWHVHKPPTHEIAIEILLQGGVFLLLCRALVVHLTLCSPRQARRRQRQVTPASASENGEEMTLRVCICTCTLELPCTRRCVGRCSTLSRKQHKPMIMTPWRPLCFLCDGAHLPPFFLRRHDLSSASQAYPCLPRCSFWSAPSAARRPPRTPPQLQACPLLTSNWRSQRNLSGDSFRDGEEKSVVANRGRASNRGHRVFWFSFFPLTPRLLVVSDLRHRPGDRP